MVDLKLYECAAPQAALLLAHGAGAGQGSPFMVRAAAGLAERGIATATFDFAYIAEGRKVPDRAPVLESTLREAAVRARTVFGALPLFVGGKSMGGRIASQVASQGLDGAAGLVFLGYPLHPPGRPETRRDAHLPSIREPMLFVQGARDAFGTAEEIRRLLPRLQDAELRDVPGGDHSFKVPGRQGAAAPDVVGMVLDHVRDWILRRARRGA